MRARVVGAGISGLTSALRLQEDGWQVEIWAAERPSETVSAVAAAIWYPFRSQPRERVGAWSARTLEVLLELVNDPASGVRRREGVEVWRSVEPDVWAGPLAGIPGAPLADVPAGLHAGTHLSLPVVEMPIHLQYLTDRFERSGGRVLPRVLTSLAEALPACDLLVNCSGLGARALVPDPRVHPIRGQVVRVENPGIERFILDLDPPTGTTYVIPRSRDCILGGTVDVEDWNPVPDPETAREILSRCLQLEPGLRHAAILEHRVGLRPGRGAVRLEADSLGGVPLIHNYGHGGSGVTVSWGCAEEVAAIARSCL